MGLEIIIFNFEKELLFLIVIAKYINVNAKLSLISEGKFYSSVFCYRIKSLAASKYGLASQPRLVDIIAAVPAAYKKVCFSILTLNLMTKIM